MARTARDLALLLDVMAGPDPLTLGVAHTGDAAAASARGPRRLPGSGPRGAPLHRDRRSGARGREPGGRRPDVQWCARRTAQSAPARSGRSRVDSIPSCCSPAPWRDFPVDAPRTTADSRSRSERRRSEPRRGAVARDGVEPPRLDRDQQPSRASPPGLAATVRRVRCRRVSDHADSAFGHDHNPDLLERRLDIDGVEYAYFDQLVWAGLATMPGLPATATTDGGIRRGTAGRSAAHRSAVRGPHHAEACRTARTGDRRLPTPAVGQGQGAPR